MTSTSTNSTGPAPRIASLLPSATEIVCALGLRDSLVGVSHECDWPEGVARLPHLTSSKVYASALSRDIDRDVMQLLRDALAVYDVDVDGLRKSDPEVIITQDLCEVCAVSPDDVHRALRELGNPDIDLINLHPTRLEDILEDMLRIGRALGRSDQAESVVTQLRARIERVAKRVGDVALRPTVLTIEWLDPIMVGGTWMPDLIEIAGGQTLVAKAGRPAPTLTREELAALSPDVVLIKPCGFSLERCLKERKLLHELLDPMDWPAVQEGRIFLADGNAYFNRPGPRIVDSLEILASCLHPDLFPEYLERYASRVLRWPA